MTPAQQAHVFVVMLLCGAGLGVVYDALWVIRCAVFRGRAARALLDLLYGLICAAGAVMSALCLRIDVFRWYTLLGMLGGMILYAASAGLLMRRMAAICRKICEKKSEKGRKLTK